MFIILWSCCWYDNDAMSLMINPSIGFISQTVHELIIEVLWKLVCPNNPFNHPIRSQICTCYDSLAVVTCAKLWSDLIIIFHIGVNVFLTNFHFKLLNCLWDKSQVHDSRGLRAVLQPRAHQLWTIVAGGTAGGSISSYCHWQQRSALQRLAAMTLSTSHGASWLE